MQATQETQATLSGGRRSKLKRRNTRKQKKTRNARKQKKTRGRR